MMTFSKGILCVAALTLLALVFHAAIGAGSDEGGVTSHAASVNTSGNETASIPDFDSDGTVGFSDFLAFAGAFGSRQGDEKYNATYDLNGDGEIGFADFLIFAQHFGKEALPDDSAVLVALYHATDGPNWVNNENWLTDAPLGDWFGVDTDASGRVVRIGLSGRWDNEAYEWVPHGLRGAIPPELGKLTNLRDLNLGSNHLTGPIPPELGKLTNLTGLNLFVNELTGPIPPEFGNLTNLRHLNVDTNKLTGPIPPELGKLTNLNYLILHANDLTGPIPPELGKLTNLEDLGLARTRLEGAIPQSFLQLTRLRHLGMWITDLCVPGTSAFVAWLRGIESRFDIDRHPLCNAADAAVLKRLYEVAGGADWTESAGWPGDGAVEAWHGVSADSLGRVTALALSDNGLSGTLPRAIVNLDRLVSLRINGNPSLSGRLPLSLVSLSLRTLHYSGTGLCAPAERTFRDWLGALPSHHGTGDECPPLTDREILEILYQATDGSNWVRNENWVTDAPLGEWHGVKVDDQGRVVELELGLNDLRGRIPLELGSLTHLESLSLYFNGGDLEGPIPSALGNLANLRALLLGNNGLTGAIPPELGNLTNLEWLFLDHNDLSGPIPPELGSLVKLRGLSLNENRLSGTIPIALANLADLRSLNIHQNELTGPIPARFGNLSRLERLSLYLNGLVGPLPAELGGLAALRELHVGHNRLHGNVPLAFQGLTNLRDLTLAGNADMSGALPVGLAALESLETLSAGGTGLCAPSDAAFTEWLARFPNARVARCGVGDMPAAAYLVQAVQSREFPVPLVAGEQALLRVFVTASRDNGEPLPPVRATFHRAGASVHVAEIPAGAGPIPTEVDEGSLAVSANAVIPADVIRPGLEMTIEIDPDGTLDSALGVARRIPEEGRLAVDVREMPLFELTVIPFLGRTNPDSAILGVTAAMAADPHGHELLADTRTMLPVGDLEVTAHEPVSIAGNHHFHMGRATRMIRALEGGGGYWMGMMSGEVKGGAGAGPNLTSTMSPEYTAIAHELGHNMTLPHTPDPCGGANGPDPAYPYSDGSIGAWGYDFDSRRLVRPSTYDLMGYCGAWVSDYNFAKALRFRLEGEGAYASAASNETSGRSLLVWGSVDAEGAPFLEPVFAVAAPPVLPDSAGEYRITGRSAEGAQLFSFSFAMTEPCDVVGESSFVFVLPVRPGWEALASVTLSGPDGAAALDGDSDVPMAILRDPVTGKVRSILRDLPRSAVAQAAAKIATGAQGLEVLFSRGIPENLIPEPDNADTRR